MEVALPLEEDEPAACGGPEGQTVDDACFQSSAGQAFGGPVTFSITNRGRNRRCAKLALPLSPRPPCARCRVDRESTRQDRVIGLAGSGRQ